MTSKIAAKLLLFVTVVLVSACGGGSSSESPGITVSFAISPEVMTQNDNAQSSQIAKTFTNTEGTKITLKTAYLTVWSVELNSDCTNSIFTKLPEKILNFMLPSAHAHADSSPMVLSTPFVININAEKENVVDIGSISPPPGNYCGASITFFPADEDARDLPESPNMIGRTLYIEGSYTETEGTTTNFNIDLSTRLREKGLSFPTMLSLSSDNLASNKTIELNYSHWFDGVNFKQLASDDSQDLILNNLRDAVFID